MANVKNFRPTEDDVRMFEQLFPNDGNYNSATAFHTMIEAVAAQRAGEQAAAINAEAQQRIETLTDMVERIAEMYETPVSDLAETCAHYKREYLDYRDQAARYGTENGLLHTEIDRLKASESELKATLQATENSLQAAENNLKTTENELQATLKAAENDNCLHIVFQPFARKLLDLTVERLAERYGRQVSAEQVLIDMFLRYTVFQYTQWFYPFVIKNKEIVEIARAFNSEISTIDQVKKLF